MSVCLSVCLLTHLTYGASVLPEKAVMYSAGKEGLKICGDLPETTAFKSYATKQEHHALQLQREAWPTSAHAHWHSTQDSSKTCSMRRGFAL